MKIIGIDIGTTTISEVVLDMENQNVIKSITLPNGNFIKTENPWERIQNVSAIIDTARKELDQLLSCYSDIAGIGLTGQMHGIVYLDKAGNAVSPLYTWQDERGNLPEFNGKSLVSELKDQYGINVSTGYGLVTHLYNIQKKLVPEAAVSLCTIADYLGLVLTGRKRPLMHISNAASLGFFDVSEYHFMTDILRTCGMSDISLSILPEITTELSVLGFYHNIPVTAAIGDNQASFLGSAGRNSNTVLINMGTGGQISVLSKICYETPGIEARPFLKDSYLLVGSSLCGGRAYAILENFLRSYAAAAGAEEVEQYAIMEKLAEKAVPLIEEPDIEKNGPENTIQSNNHSASAVKNNLTVSTTFNGTRVNPVLRGSILNISENNFTPENLIYGVLEGMARELYDMYRLIYSGTGIKAKHLIGSGNGLRKNRILQTIFCKLFQSELKLSSYEEEAACGAAISSTIIGS